MKTAYLMHIVLWMLPVLAGQWIIGWRIFRANIKPLLWPTMILGSYLTLADAFAIHWGIWSFDGTQTIGVHVAGMVPLEEVLFFFVTALLISQSLVLFLPDRLRCPVRSATTPSG